MRLKTVAIMGIVAGLLLCGLAWYCAQYIQAVIGG